MEWIDVNDRLPEKGVQVLCYGKHPQLDENIYYAAKYIDDLFGFSIIGIGGLEITHSMPLPDKPNPTH